MSDDQITITVDGQELKANKGQMLIEVTDAAGIDIPRFCYHRKLSVAANCRMCLVEVEKAPKPLPACATPVMPDMIVKTRSSLALAAQKGTMEFLLINHPLDCPICDQGGECELQDVAMGYGGSASQYTEGKRVVLDKYIGPLIATEMTRCIHCTRCVRFGEEIAGIRELGATGRGEDVRIGTYIAQTVDSEVSGNVIDICPVGALTARPSRFTARSWELQQVPAIATHDSIGSNIFVHIDNGKVNRVVPRENESINEVWISDRDRFSYPAWSSDERLRSPLIRSGSELVETDWETALGKAAELLGNGKQSNSLGILASPTLSLEELYLAQKLGRALGTNNIDHRLGQRDFSADNSAPVMPWLGLALDQLEQLQSALLIGSNIRKDQPIAALRLRKSALSGAAISFINPRRFPLHFDAAHEMIGDGNAMVQELLAVAKAANADLSAIENLPASIEVEQHHQQVAKSLADADKSMVCVGNIATQHPSYAVLLRLASALASATSSTVSMLPERANTCGAWLAGCVPHRKAGGVDLGHSGASAGQMLSSALDSYLLLGTEPEFDAANPALAMQTLKNAKHVVAVSQYLSDGIAESADVVLPMALSTESYGTWVNAVGTWQSTRGFATPPGQARQGWKILKVLADMLDLSGFDYVEPASITAEVQQACSSVELDNRINGGTATLQNGVNAALQRMGETPIYATDPVVRRAAPLQKTADAASQRFAAVSPAAAASLQLEDGEQVRLVQRWEQGSGEAVLPLRIDDTIPDGTVWVPTGIPETRSLGSLFDAIELTKQA